MIVGVRGILEAVGPDWVYLRVGGVTLQVFVPASTIGSLGPVGGEVHLFTDLRIRDDQLVLHGFSSLAAHDLFLLLLSVSGIGPRTALALLSGLGAQGLRNAIAAGDVAALSTVRGVGRRTASRLVLELKGKLEVDESAPIASSVGDDAEVISALVALGYSTAEARRAVAAASPPGPLSTEAGEGAGGEALTLEDRIRLALQHFGSGR